jgi:hypothetical protein
MPIVGNLSEFPLPEVLLLIGIRTGRLRLLDVPEFGVLDIDISSGEVQTMHIGGETFSDTRKMLDKLSAIVQAQSGMFEFRLAPVSLAPRTNALSIHDLAIQLVCHVDEQTAKQSVAPAIEQRHRLVIPQPEIWVEPELNQFFQDALTLLTSGVSQDELAHKLGIDPGLVYKHLTHLRLLGLTELLEGEAAVAPKEEPIRGEEITNKSSDLLRKTAALQHKNTAFIQAVHIKERIRKLSTG